MLQAFADGSGTHHADSPACIGVVVADASGRILCESSAYICPGTNNVAELWAIRRALYLIRWVAHEHAAGCDTPAVLYSDSAYAIGCARGEYNIKKNVDLVREIQGVYEMHKDTVRLEHVKGHNGNPGNELADWLAGIARHRVIELRKSVGFAVGRPWAMPPFRSRPVGMILPPLPVPA